MKYTFDQYAKLIPLKHKTYRKRRSRKAKE